MPETPAPPDRWRLDAVALTLLTAGVILAAGIGSYTPISGRENLLGPAGDEAAAWLVNSVGLGALTLVLGWLTVIALYIARRSWQRIAIRAVGWLILVGVSATIADHMNDWISIPVSTFGKGGAVGAYVHITLDASTKAPLPMIGLIATAVLGLSLAADGLVRIILNVTWFVLKKFAVTLVRGNSLVGRIGDRFIRGLAGVASLFRRPEGEVVELAPILEEWEPTAELPITRPPDPLKLFPADESLNETPGPVPITRPTVLSQTPSPLRLLGDHEPEEEDPTSPEAYELPPLNILADPVAFPVADHEQKLRDRATLLEKTFTDFGLAIKVVGIHAGPVITQYEISLDVGLRLNKVTTLADDLALNLGVSSVRIVAPLPGRNTVGIELPNEHRQSVRLKELILATSAKTAKFKLPIFLGKDVEGRPLVYDMATMPHLLIAGRTGTGKSVCLNSIILSFLFTRRPDECRMIMIDPKKVELSEYGKVPHLMHPVVTDDKKAEAILAWAVDKMEERYELLRRARVRNIASYNELAWEEILRRVDPESEEERQALPRNIPYIVIIVDEVGDLLMSMKKEVESHIIRLAQKSRAAGIHLILATQKPTVDVITGLIKSNLPARICFQVASRADSAVVLDEKGAEKLLGMGDMLFLQPGTSSIIRAQGAYVDDNEIAGVVSALEVHEPHFEAELLNLKAKDSTASGGDLGEKLRDRDAMYEQAIDIVIREQRGSTSLLQRSLGIGYGRASRLIDFMAEDGIVGGFNGSNARDVLVSSEEWELRKKGA